MKRVTIYIAHLLVLVLTGCDKTVLEFPENGGVDPTLVNVNLTLAIDPKIESYVPAERSKASEADLYDVRWIVEVFRDEIAGEPVQRYVLGCEQAADGHHTIHTSLALHAARYHVVAWMDYVDDGSVSDKYYTIPSLSAISVPEAGSYIGNEEHKDTYVARQEIDLKGYRDRWNETVDATVTLQRPMAKIEFITTDIDKFLDELAVRRPKMTGAVAGDLLSKAPDLSTIRVQVDYAGYFPSGFNAYTNKPNDARTGMGFGCNMTPLTGKEAHLASDYIFVNGSESAVKVNLTIRDSEGNLLNRIEGIDVPIVRGKLTTIRDEFLTRLRPRHRHRPRFRRRHQHYDPRLNRYPDEKDSYHIISRTDRPCRLQQGREPHARPGGARGRCDLPALGGHTGKRTRGQGGNARGDSSRTNIDLHLRGMDKGRQSPMRTA